MPRGRRSRRLVHAAGRRCRAPCRERASPSRSRRSRPAAGRSCASPSPCRTDARSGPVRRRALPHVSSHPPRRPSEHDSSTSYRAPDGCRRESKAAAPDGANGPISGSGGSSPRPLAEPQDGDVRQPCAALALVDAEVLETPLHAIGERCRMPARVGENEHADGARLSVAHGREHERLGRRRLAAHDLGDRAHVRARLRTEKGERDVEAVERAGLARRCCSPQCRSASLTSTGTSSATKSLIRSSLSTRSARGHADV